MKKIFFLTCLIFSLSTYSQNNKSKIVTIDAIKRQLNVIESKYIAALPFDQRREAISEVNTLLNMIDRMSVNKKTIHDRHYDIHLEIMSEETFDLFLTDLKNAWPDDKKYKIYVKYISIYKITVNQLVMISSLITFDRDKVEAITLLYPSVIDKENAMKLIDVVDDKSTLIDSLKLSNNLFRK